MSSTACASTVTDPHMKASGQHAAHTAGDVPLVTFFVFVFNQKRFLREAVLAAFAQTYSNLEIIISDDCSTDGSQEIIRSLCDTYRGPHRVRANMNDSNLGIGRHVNLAFKLAHGDLLVLAAGDDVSVPQRTQRIVDAWLSRNRKPCAIYSGGAIINADGQPTGVVNTAVANGHRSALAMITYRKGAPLLLLGACSAYTPSVIGRFGPLLDELGVEDIPLSIRAAMLGGFLYIDEELVKYRENVSVWLPRKLAGEDFGRHQFRMAYRIAANHMVARQIFRDTRLLAPRPIRRAAAQRLLAARCAHRMQSSGKFSIKAYIRVLYLTPYWRATFFPAILFTTPTIHRLLFALQHRLSRKSR